MHRSSERERRRYPRRSVRGGISVELRVEVSGDKPAMLLTRGMVADISCGGIRCDIDLDVPVGTRVGVCFRDMPEGVLAPELVDGRVVRTESLGGVPDHLAIAFAHPLRHLDIAQLPTAHATPVIDDAAHGRQAHWPDGTRGAATLALNSFL